MCLYEPYAVSDFFPAHEDLARPTGGRRAKKFSKISNPVIRIVRITLRSAKT